MIRTERRRPRWVFLLGLGVLALASTGCARRARVVYAGTPSGGAVIYQPPPPAQVVVQRPPAPYANAVWVEGHWQWNGTQHVWVPGYWVQARPGYSFIQPGWVRRGNQYVYVRGGWGRGGRVVHYVNPAPAPGVVVRPGFRGPAVRARVAPPRQGGLGVRGRTRATVYGPGRGAAVVQRPAPRAAPRGTVRVQGRRGGATVRVR